MRHPEEYPFNEGRIVSTRGLDIPVADYEAHFVEEHVEHSTAVHSRRIGAGSYFVGPLARYNLNADLLAPRAREAAAEAGLETPCRNPFRSIIVRAVETLHVRAVETLHACEEALRLIEGYEPPERPFVPAEPRAGTGYGCTEATRGMLYHRYRLDEQGLILEACIVPPTSQNQKKRRRGPSRVCPGACRSARGRAAVALRTSRDHARRTREARGRGPRLSRMA